MKIYLVILPLLLFSLLWVDKGDIVLQVAQQRNDTWTLVFKTLTVFGDGLIYAILLLLCVIIQYRLTPTLLLSGALQLGIIWLCKRELFRGAPRPRCFFSGEVDHLLVADTSTHCLHSFPSGHTTTAFGAACFLAILLGRFKVAWPLVMLALLVSFSRVYLFQHFWVDIVFGSMAGVASTAFAFFLVQFAISLARASSIKTSTTSATL